MKKTALILILCLTACLLFGCGRDNTETTRPDVDLSIQPLEGEPVPVDTSRLKRFDLSCGLTFYGGKELKIQPTEGMAAYLSNSVQIVMIIEEPKAGSVLEGKSLEEYADLLTGNNGLTPCVYDKYGNLATAYLADSDADDGQFYYYVTVKETEESFWLVQMICRDTHASTYSDMYAQWSSTLSATPQS